MLCVQGPPGTGKTSTGSHVIASLLRAGKRVGVTSHSHKAILNLVRNVGKVLGSEQPLTGIKVGGDADDAIFAEFPRLQLATAREALDVYRRSGGLVAGTAWLFSREEWDGVLDYLIVDEAGQVSLANLVGVSLAARNLILLGDQMQLEQPIQGTHPGETGTSALQYYLQDHATVPPELGIFLDRSFRMHPDVCRFISDTVYEGRLESVSEAAQQRIANPTGRLIQKEAGIQFIPVQHDGNTQASDEEIEKVAAVFSELRGRPFRDSKGQERPLSLQDFLFISPYNLQVNRLRARLPDGARVGSVDKFQGQEAPVTIFSLGSSFGEYGSRGLSFLLDRNRINVAISRAQCLAVVVGDPRIARHRSLFHPRDGIDQSLLPPSRPDIPSASIASRNEDCRFLRACNRSILLIPSSIQPARGILQSIAQCRKVVHSGYGESAASVVNRSGPSRGAIGTLCRFAEMAQCQPASWMGLWYR